MAKTGCSTTSASCTDFIDFMAPQISITFEWGICCTLELCGKSCVVAFVHVLGVN